MSSPEKKTKRERPYVSPEAKAAWDKAIAEQQEAARNPRSQQQAEEFAKAISYIPPLEWLRQFTI